MAEVSKHFKVSKASKEKPSVVSLYCQSNTKYKAFPFIDLLSEPRRAFEDEI